MSSSGSTYDEHAVQWAKRRKKGHHPAHDFLEKPAMYDMLPADLSGLSVLCLGSGSGEECDVISRRGARYVLGVDSSEMLTQQARLQFPDLEFQQGNIESWNYPHNHFDIVFSSLTFHYIDNWVDLLTNIKLSLKPGGMCIFSAHHPIKWGARTYRSKEKNQFLMGYTKSKNDSSYEIYGDYLTKRPLKDTLFGNTPIIHYHRPISQMIQDFTQSGFQIVEMREPQPIPKSKASLEDFYEVHSKIPLFICWKIKK